LIARRVGPVHGKLVASPDYIREHGAPKTPDELLTHQALMQGTETWQLIDGDKTISIHPQGRFKADNGTALAAAAVAGSASLGFRIISSRAIWIPAPSSR
jgi:DNA-binding transcriptional LysR family regulator